uniref:ribosome biogenesis regulatory protein homolog n=1 Tax=Myodes glareolus TaxID=447135 RepID=UPI0020210153|nr:ribosome biogenesis regulatory protein homolog [Myodes glareolus]
MESQSVEELLAKAEREEAEKLQRITVHKDLELEFDLGNLLASDRNPPTVLRQAGPSPEAELRALARDNTQLLINQLWQLPTERVEEAVVARLPEPLNELNRLRNLARAHKMQMPSSAGLHPTGHQSKEELGRAMQVAKVSTASVGRFQERLPKEKAPRGTGKKRKFQPLFGDFAAERKSQLELLRVMNSKKPQLDVTRATNKQMREEDQEEAAKRRKMGQKGRRKGGRQGPSGKKNGGPPGPGEKRKGGLGGRKPSRPPAFGGKKKGAPHQGGKRKK